MQADDDRSILDARIRVPEHVVYRDFSDETVILNLESGMYHGLSPTAARMLEEVQKAATVAAAVNTLTAELGQPRTVIERDLIGFCRALEERGLVERHAG
jgi:hypothetical protein